MPRPVTIPLAAGLQTELADQLVQPGATLLHENMVHPQTGKARVRFGSDVLSTASQATLPASGTLPTPWQLATLGGSLVRFNRAPEPLHVWAPVPEAWVRHAQSEGGLLSYRRGPIKVDTSPVFSGATESLSRPTLAVSEDTIVSVCQAASATASNIIVTIIDRSSRRPLYTRQTTAGSITPRVAIVGTRAVVAYEQGGSLQVDAYNLTTYTLAEQVTLGSLLSDTPIDIRVGAPVVGANNVGILYRTVTSGELRCAVVDATALATNSTFTPRTTAGAAVVPGLAFGWMQDLGASGKFAIMIADTTNGLRTLWDLPAPTAGNSDAVATHVLDAAATAAPAVGTAGIRNVIGTTTSSLATGLYRVLYEVTAPSLPTQATIKAAVWTGSALLATQFLSVGIRSKFWQHSTNFYFLAGFAGADQESYFVLAVTNDLTPATSTYPAPLAVALPRDARGLTSVVNAATDVGVAPDGAVYLAAESIVRVDESENAGTATGTDVTVYAIETIRLRHAAAVETEVGRPAEFLRSLFVPGGLLGHFDGATYASACFPYYPPPPTVLTPETGGNLEASAAYLYRFIYSFVDRNGRKWRSAASVQTAAATTGTEQSFELTIETLRLVDRGVLLAGTNVPGGFLIEVYRTQANAAEGFFQVAVIANDPTSHTVTLVDNVADDDLGEQLYTDGNGLENQLLPPIAWCVEHQGRLVCGESGTGTIWYSNEADFTNGLIFNETTTFDVGDPTDPTTGGAVFGEQLFVFKSGKVYIVGGQGANTLGQGQTYLPRLIDGGVGCDNPQSVVVADDGVWFRSSSDRAGIHRTAGGSAEYVGQGVHAQDGLTITSAVIVRSATEIRFYTETGTTLIWNWTTKLWSTNTVQPCLSATTGYAEAAGVVYARASDGYVMAESTTRHQEGLVAYTGKIRSPWYQAGGLAGWQRIRRLQGVGDGGSAHTATVRLYKDMATSPFQSAALTFNGSAQRWNWEMRPAQQKASATMIEVEIGPPASTAIVVDVGDEYLGSSEWSFVNGAFTSGHIGGTLVIAGTPGGAYDGTYQITAVASATNVTLSPDPAGASGLIDATSITLTLPQTAGPDIIGVALIPVSKEGMDKVPSSRRVT
jgi:hypothetical protein